MESGECRDAWLFKMLRISTDECSVPNRHFKISFLWFREYCSRKQGKEPQNYLLGKARPLQSWTHSSCGYLDWVCTRNVPSTVRHGWRKASKWPYLSLLNHVPTNDPTRLLWIVLNTGVPGNGYIPKSPDLGKGTKKK